MAISKKNQGLLNLVKRVHGIVENADIEKHRQSQDQLGALFGQNKAILIKEVDIEGMYGEWLCVNRSCTATAAGMLRAAACTGGR